MENYLGTTIIKQEDSIFSDYTKEDFALFFIKQYGGIDGSHHKDWLIDQVARILNDTKIIIELAKWKCGHEEYRLLLGEPSKKYNKFVESCKDGEDGTDTYDYEVGIAP